MKKGEIYLAGSDGANRKIGDPLLVLNSGTFVSFLNLRSQFKDSAGVYFFEICKKACCNNRYCPTRKDYNDQNKT